MIGLLLFSFFENKILDKYVLNFRIVQAKTLDVFLTDLNYKLMSNALLKTEIKKQLEAVLEDRNAH